MSCDFRSLCEERGESSNGWVSRLSLPLRIGSPELVDGSSDGHRKFFFSAMRA